MHHIKIYVSILLLFFSANIFATLKSHVLRIEYTEKPPIWAQTKLTDKMISFLIFQLHEVSHKYYHLGIKLNIPDYVLKQYSNSNPQLALAQMLHYWHTTISTYQETCYYVNIDYLLSALESMNYMTLAEKICKEIQKIAERDQIHEMIDFATDDTSRQNIHFDPESVPVSFMAMARSRKINEELLPWTEIVPHPMDTNFLLKIISKDLNNGAIIFAMLSFLGLSLDVPVQYLESILGNNSTSKIIKFNNILQKWYSSKSCEQFKFMSLIHKLTIINHVVANDLQLSLEKAYRLVSNLPAESIKNSITQTELIEGFSIESIVEMLESIDFKWIELGTLLEIDYYNIKYDTNNKHNLSQILHLWKKQCPNAKIETLIVALRNELLKQETLAQDLESLSIS